MIFFEDEVVFKSSHFAFVKSSRVSGHFSHKSGDGHLFTAATHTCTYCYSPARSRCSWKWPNKIPPGKKEYAPSLPTALLYNHCIKLSDKQRKKPGQSCQTLPKFQIPLFLLHLCPVMCWNSHRLSESRTHGLVGDVSTAMLHCGLYQWW